MERRAPDYYQIEETTMYEEGPAIPVFEPPMTRTTQITMCFSFLTSLVVLRVISVATKSTITNEEDVKPIIFTHAQVLCTFLAFWTILHHLIVLVLCFRQRRAKYLPSEIPTLVPMTARRGVMVTAWMAGVVWMVALVMTLAELRGQWRSAHVPHRWHLAPDSNGHWHARMHGVHEDNSGHGGSWSWLPVAIATVLAFTIGVMCTRERLETLDRLEGLKQQNVVFVVGERGEYMVVEGP